MDQPGIADTPSIGIQNDNVSVSYSDSDDSFQWGYDSAEWETPAFEQATFSLEMETLPETEMAESEELLLALNQVQQQAGRLEQAITGLQDAAVDQILELDDAATETIGGAISQGNALLESLSREMGLLSSMAKQFSDTGPELRDGIMLEGIMDGSERAVEAGHEADVITSGLNSMAEALGSGQGGEAAQSAFVSAMEAALLEAKAAAERQDGAKVEIDLYNARQGVTGRNF